MAIQALQPRVKELQSRYANEPETLQLETAKLYKDAGASVAMYLYLYCICIARYKGIYA